MDHARLLADLVAIDSVNPALVPAPPARPRSLSVERCAAVLVETARRFCA